MPLRLATLQPYSSLARHRPLKRRDLPGHDVHVKTHRLIPGRTDLDVMVARREPNGLGCRRELTNRSDAHVVHEQLRARWCDVEAHTTHVRLIGLHHRTPR